MDPKLLEELLNTLKIPRGASHAEVLQNYRRAALAYHPDKGGDEEKMKRLNHLIKLYKEQQCQAEAAEEPDLHAEETLSDSEEEEDTPNDSAYGSSSASFSQQTPTTGTPGAGSPRHVSVNAVKQMMQLKHALLQFFHDVERKRKQCIEPSYIAAKRAYLGVPWDELNELLP
ncbi:putative small t antigen [Gammapolyomavirus phacarbo]|uniref:Small t antigen n=1 Tax=cormorant polyomavirus 1 TaxID=2896467 RepID=A0A8K1VVC8_9POLY|nr:putative small t antigen [cormorant polyomavirus 1]